MPKVLIYEGVNGHGECLPSYYYYFKELGYEVDFAIKNKIVDEKALWMLDNPTIYSIVEAVHKSQHVIELEKKVPNLFKYDLYFISTLNKDCYKTVQFLYRNGISRNKILFQDHLNYKYFLEQSGKDILLGKNGFTLGMADQHILSQLSPIKSINNFRHKNLTKNFEKDLNIFIGGLSHIHFKNFEKFIKAVEELNNEGYNIKINVTGIRELGDYILPESSCINYLGRIDFKSMANQYIINDFLFVLFDTKALMCLKDHQTFLDGRVSGSKNMSIIYKIPLVVQKPFQLAWGLDDNNSISYNGNDYKEVLLDLFKIKMDRYNNIIENLKIKEKQEFELGLNNLKNKIDNLNKSIIKKVTKKNKYF